MLWSCPRITSRRKNRKVRARFTGLAILLVKRLLAMHSCALHPPALPWWRAALLRWGEAESSALHWEEASPFWENPEDDFYFVTNCIAKKAPKRSPLSQIGEECLNP
ncbi:hypothetical protein NDU88_006226 [Pleurodeles waltl]|uniref:Uncharacterized protein n=1 Tax=Pleurodeles waltl TaxID=8319 RepID=A0AAV7RPI5_PLEWA|nr:hypothetical protein NDU88_006226 [Pleurodeles waltl]